MHLVLSNEGKKAMSNLNNWHLNGCHYPLIPAYNFANTQLDLGF